jgi:hypothetical protein
MQLRLILYLIKRGFEGLSHLFLAFYVIDVVLKCALSLIVWVLFVSFSLSFILPKVRGTTLIHITPAVLVGVWREKKFIVFNSQFSWPKKLNIL